MSKNISFISESVIEDQKKKRQEQWEQTRKEDDPIEPPEVPYDHRTLYERLQEQKLKKQEAYDESHKLKNLIKGLDNDEIEFLNVIDSNKAQLENRKYQEELLALEEYKRGVVHLNTEEQDRKLLEFKRELFQLHKNKLENQSKSKKSQSDLLSGVIKRKGKDAPVISKKAKLDSTNKEGENISSETSQLLPTIKCIGILPGIGNYDDNSDSDDSDRESDEDDCIPFKINTLQIAKCSKRK